MKLMNLLEKRRSLFTKQMIAKNILRIDEFQNLSKNNTTSGASRHPYHHHSNNNKNNGGDGSSGSSMAALKYTPKIF